jgi:hypothetical protein
VRAFRGFRSPEKTVGIQQATGGLVDGLPEEGFTPRLVDSYWTKGAAIMVCQDEETRDWIAARVTTLVAWEGSRHKMVSRNALLTCKREVASF